MKHHYQLGGTEPGKWEVIYNHNKLPMDEFAGHVAVGLLKKAIDAGDIKLPKEIDLFFATTEAWNCRLNADGLLAPICVHKYRLRLEQPEQEQKTA